MARRPTSQGTGRSWCGTPWVRGGYNHHKGDWVDAPDLRLLRYVPPADEVGERTRDQKDAEERKRAIDLTEGTMDTPRKRIRADDVETRVAKARSLCASEVDARAHELMEDAVREFIAKKIDGASLSAGERPRASKRRTSTSRSAPSTRPSPRTLRRRPQSRRRRPRTRRSDRRVPRARLPRRQRDQHRRRER